MSDHHFNTPNLNILGSTFSTRLSGTNDSAMNDPIRGIGVPNTATSVKMSSGNKTLKNHISKKNGFVSSYNFANGIKNGQDYGSPNNLSLETRNIVQRVQTTGINKRPTHQKPLPMIPNNRVGGANGSQLLKS